MNPPASFSPGSPRLWVGVTAGAPRCRAVLALRRTTPTMSELVRLILDAVDESLLAAWRAFSFGVASAVGEQISFAANTVLRPLLFRLRAFLGNVWRDWMAIAAVGLLLRALRNALVSSKIAFTAPSRARALDPQPQSLSRHYPGMHHGPPPIPVPGGAWHFVPHDASSIGIDEDMAMVHEVAAQGRTPLLLTHRGAPHSRL